MINSQQPIKLIETGGKPMMQFLNCSIDFPQSNGLYFVSSGCGAGKTTIIAEIAQKYRSDGVLIVVPTIDAAEDLRSQLQPIGTYILHSGELSSDRLLNYRNDPESLRNFDVLVITSARFQLDPMPLFTAYHNTCRGLILVDELINFYPEQPVDPIELKNVLTYIDDQPGLNGKLIDPDNKLYQHIYQDMVMMNAAYKCSGLNLMKLGNRLEKYKLNYLFSQIQQNNSFKWAKGNLDSLKDDSRVVLFDGTIDSLANSTDSRILPVTGSKYSSDITFTEFPLPFTRKSLTGWNKNEVSKYLNGLVEIVKKESEQGRVLIITWMSLYLQRTSIDELEADKKPESDFCKLLSDYLASDAGINQDKFSVIYRGSGHDRGSNEFRDYTTVVFFGEWNIPENIVNDINHMFGLNCDYEQYMESLLIQTICRLRIRQHKGLPIRVYYTDDLRKDRIYKVQEYFRSNSLSTCTICGVPKPIIAKKKPEKKYIMDLVALYSYDSKIRDAIESNLRYNITISLDELYNIIPRDRKAKSRYDNLIRFLSLYQISLTIS